MFSSSTFEMFYGDESQCLGVWDLRETGCNAGTHQHAASVTREPASVPFMVRSVSVLPNPIIPRVTELSKVSELDTTAAVTYPPVN